MNDHADHADHAAHDIHYIRVWGYLVVLLVISVIGPMLGHPLLTVFTAFGIAVIKAYLVAKNFMHINLEQRFVGYAIVTCLVFMFLFFAGTAPDVMKAEGERWVKPAWVAAQADATAGHAEAHH